MTEANKFDVRELREDGTIVEISIREGEPVPPCTHPYRYVLFLGRDTECLVRYDNRLGGGDRREVGGVQEHYLFVSVEKLLDDFQKDIELWE